MHSQLQLQFVQEQNKFICMDYNYKFSNNQTKRKEKDTTTSTFLPLDVVGYIKNWSK